MALIVESRSLVVDVKDVVIGSTISFKIMKIVAYLMEKNTVNPMQVFLSGV